MPTGAPTLERRTERTSRLTRETVTVRTHSPLKPFSDSRTNGRRSREAEAPAAQDDEDTVKAKNLAPGNYTQMESVRHKLIIA